MISALIAPVLKKLAAIFRQVLNGGKHRTSLLPGVAPVCVKGRATAGRRKARVRELGHNAYSVWDTLCPKREKPPPLAWAAP